MASPKDALLNKATSDEYQHGFSSDIITDLAPKGLNEQVIRLISHKKKEPWWLLDWRLKAFAHFKTMRHPQWQNLKFPPIDFQDIIYYAAPKKPVSRKNLDEVDPKVLETFDKLGIPLEEQKRLSGVAVDAVLDSVSVATTFQKTLKKQGIIFCSFSKAVQKHPRLVRKYLGTVVPFTDNFYAALNAAVFSDGSFCYIPKGVRCPVELSTYFRINSAGTGQFERTLIVAEADSFVSYLEGCTAPARLTNQLHAAVVEIIAMDGAQVKYSTVQNWYPGDKQGRGGIYNFVTKRGVAHSDAFISWTQIETGSAITWKYPSVILKGDNSRGEFYSVAITKNHQQADTGTKMIHLGKNTRSRIISKGISAGHSRNTYRGQVKMTRGAKGARNFTQCDSLLLGDKCAAFTFPYLDLHQPTAMVEHEASTSRVSEEQLLYLRSRGIPQEEAIGMVVGGFSQEVLKRLPMEFAVEARRLLTVAMEGSVG